MTYNNLEEQTQKVAISVEEKIRIFSEAVDKLLSGPLMEDTIFLLIQAACPTKFPSGKYGRRKTKY